MTTLRQAAQQAFEALEGWDNYGAWVWPESALEQSKRNTTDALAALCEALEQPEQKTCGTCEALARTVMLDQTSHDTQRKPLTDEEIHDLDPLPHVMFDQERIDFARAIEQAHNIKEQP
jgi:hypothetical protein